MTINHAPHASQAIVNLATSAGITAEVIANSRGSHRRHHANGSTAVPQKVVLLNGIRMSLGQARQYIEARQHTWKLGTRYSPRRPWEIEIFSSLDNLLVEFDSLTTDGPEITIDLFIGDAKIENVKVEYTVGCRETGDIYEVFPDKAQAIKAIIDFEKSDADEGILEPDFYSYWAVADKEKTGGFETSTI